MIEQLGAGVTGLARKRDESDYLACTISTAYLKNNALGRAYNLH